MEPKYTSKSTYNFKEFVRLNLAIERQNAVFWSGAVIFEIAAIVLLIAYWSMGQMGNVIAFLLIALLFPPLMALRVYLPIKHVFNKNKAMDGQVTEFEFYDANFRVHNEKQNVTIPYDKLNMILLTRTNIYLLISAKQAYILTREDCTEGLVNFLAKLADKVNIQKTRRRLF